MSQFKQDILARLTSLESDVRWIKRALDGYESTYGYPASVTGLSEKVAMLITYLRVKEECATPTVKKFRKQRGGLDGP